MGQLFYEFGILVRLPLMQADCCFIRLLDKRSVLSCNFLHIFLSHGLELNRPLAEGVSLVSDHAGIFVLATDCPSHQLTCHLLAPASEVRQLLLQDCFQPESLQSMLKTSDNSK